MTDAIKPSYHAPTLQKNPKKHLEILDYGRGIAIAAVFVFHCLGALFGRDHLAWKGLFRDFSTSRSFLALLPATFGWAGVAVFFVISGFCIHLSFLRGQPNDWRGFYVRRFFRIYPPYLIALIVFAFFWPWSRFSIHSLYGWAQFISHALLIHNFDNRSFYEINPSFWSIAVEAQLYLLYPALIAVVRKIGWHRALWILGSLEVLMRCAAGVFTVITGKEEAPHWFTGLPFCYWYSWAIGAALADAFVEGRPLPFRSLSGTGLLLVAIATYFVKPLYGFSFLFFALFLVAAIAKQLECSRAFSLPRLALNQLRLLGVYSYSFYLLHQPILIRVPGLLRKLGLVSVSGHPIIAFAGCICSYPFILALSWLYYRYCELPSIKIGKLFLPNPHNRLALGMTPEEDRR